MKCFHCRGEITDERNAIVDSDYDFFHPTCHKLYVKERAAFLAGPVHSDKETARWLIAGSGLTLPDVGYEE